MYNYANLNAIEFENLCQDIMQVKLGTNLRRFAPGRDGGIDLANETNDIIVQVKHYFFSQPENLISALKNEVKKVRERAPRQYYICCSRALSPDNIHKVYALFSDFMDSESNIITLNEIEDFLQNSANTKILEKHYKLWIESTGVLQNIGNTNIFIDCETLLANIKTQIPLFVRTSAFDKALKCLDNNKNLFITGHPGVGKTMTSTMLVLYFAGNGYRVRYSTSTDNFNELKKSISRDPSVKEIILVDDCFGQAYFDLRGSHNKELLALIDYVNASPNKLLILNSRITIWQEAKKKTPELLYRFENRQSYVFTLNMDELNYIEKANILYNHITFLLDDPLYINEIKKDRRYLKIIKHVNYTPRIIEFICSRANYRNIPPEQYFDFAMEKLKNPSEIWKDEYENNLNKEDRLLLLTLYSLSDSEVEESMLKDCFEYRLSNEPNIDTTINQYEAALHRLLQGFVKIIFSQGSKKLMMVNPSVNDYLDAFLKSNIPEKRKLIRNACCIQQMRRLLYVSWLPETGHPLQPLFLALGRV